jgi:uncharacterized protein (DUF885 family)
MMVDMGLAKGDPERHIGQLSEALLRDVRLLSAIGLHTQAWPSPSRKRCFASKPFKIPATHGSRRRPPTRKS